MASYQVVGANRPRLIARGHQGSWQDDSDALSAAQQKKGYIPEHCACTMLQRAVCEADELLVDDEGRRSCLSMAALQ